MTDTSIGLAEAVGETRSTALAPRSHPAALAYVYLAVGALVSSSYFFIEGQARELVYEAIAASCVLAVVAGIWRYRPTPSLPWWLLAAGNALWLAGDVIWSWYPYFFDRDLPYPSVADAVYLSAYPLLMVAIALIVKTRGSALGREAWLDAVGIGLVAGILVWEIALEDYVANGISLAEAVNLGYPLMDVVLLAFLARLLFAPGARTVAYVLVVASMLMNFVVDIVYAREVAADWWTFDVHLNAGWLAAYVLLGAAALHPSMKTIAHGADRPEQPLTRRRTVLLAAFVALPLVELLAGEFLGQHDAHVDTAVVMIVLVGLVAYRLSSLIDASERQSMELAELHRERGWVLDEITKAIEEERTRLAAELHDGPIQRLTGYGMRAYVGGRKLRAGDEAAAAETLEGLGEGLNAEVRGLRALMSQLRPPVLSERGLVDALRDHADAIASERGIATAVDGPTNLRLPPDVETGLYRIAQEALVNACRHSQGSRVDLHVETSDHRVRLTVRDDGHGFDAAEKLGHRGGHHFGLLAMRERASMMRGDLRIESAPGKGTTVTVDVPLREEP